MRALLNPPARRGAFVVVFVVRLRDLLSRTQSLPCPPASLLKKTAFCHCRMDEDHTASLLFSDEELSCHSKLSRGAHDMPFLYFFVHISG
jgi:hypothetical protein